MEPANGRLIVGSPAHLAGLYFPGTLLPARHDGWFIEGLEELFFPLPSIYQDVAVKIEIADDPATSIFYCITGR